MRGLDAPYVDRILRYTQWCEENDVRSVQTLSDAKGHRDLPPSKQTDPDVYTRIVEQRGTWHVDAIHARIAARSKLDRGAAVSVQRDDTEIGRTGREHDVVVTRTADTIRPFLQPFERDEAQPAARRREQFQAARTRGCDVVFMRSHRRLSKLPIL